MRLFPVFGQDSENLEGRAIAQAFFFELCNNKGEQTHDLYNRSKRT
jgi:hypothetical protein